MAKINYEVLQLNSELKYLVEWTYISIFAGKPWYEFKKCNKCGENYGSFEDLITFHDGSICRQCNQSLVLVDYWAGGEALKHYEDAINTKGFTGFAAKYTEKGNEQIVGFSWGYSLEAYSRESKKEKHLKLLMENNVDLDSTFHSAETGVLSQYHRSGIGTRLAYLRLKEAKAVGFTGVHFQTINPNLVKIYHKLFGADNVLELFPNPNRPTVTVYYCEMKHLKTIDALEIL